MMKQYEKTIRANMASAEKDMRKPEDRRGFVIGAVLKIWQERQDGHIAKPQFDRLITILSEFSSGEYKDFIKEQVDAYEGGNPPTIIGY